MKFRKKKLYSLEEIRAMSKAFGQPLQKREYAKFILTPFICFAGFAYLLFHYWWMALICGLIGGSYGWFYQLRRKVKNDYEKEAFQERNNFLNNMTQLLTNDDMPLVEAFSTCTKYAEGELKRKLIDLEIALVDSDEKEVVEAFKSLRRAYKNDVQFDQYIEQLGIMFVEGRTSILTLKDTKDYHNKVLLKQQRFIEDKQQHKKDFRTMILYSIGFIVGIMLSFTLKKYVDIYAHALVGMIANTVYLSIIFYVYHQFNQRYFDDAVTEVRI
ncbi:hypothetical protein NSQ10_03310 [Bacillus sp. FSL R5-0432]|uniref:hypothetical protein n=1 Tax=Bacillus sp. FSL R5-0432 TaxID=2954585 RepID=UPI0030CB7CF3